MDVAWAYNNTSRIVSPCRIINNINRTIIPNVFDVSMLFSQIKRHKKEIKLSVNRWHIGYPVYGWTLGGMINIKAMLLYPSFVRFHYDLFSGSRRHIATQVGARAVIYSLGSNLSFRTFGAF